MTSRTILHLTNLSKLGDGRPILTGIDWRIRRGQHWALLGANGAGKTTLLRIVAGHDWPSEGEVRLLGSRFGAVDLRELRKSIGWVTSSLLAQFHPEDTALSVVASGLEGSIGLYRDFKESEFRRARRALAAIGAAAVAEQPYRTLSQGERQRVMIARALIARPALLVLDEPCAGLDPAVRESFLGDLARLARRPAAPTFIFVTHHIEEIPTFVTHGLILKDGRSLAHGPITSILTDAILSDAFACSCSIARTNGRYHLLISST